MLHQSFKILEGFLSFPEKLTRKAIYLFPMAAVVLGLSSQTSAQPYAGVSWVDPLTPLISEPPAKLEVDPPLADHLTFGLLVLQYRTENLRILPVYGQAALKISPRIGHLHITVDGGPWRWIDASNQPIILNKLPPGHHRILIEMVDPTHQVIVGQTIKFIIPEKKEIKD